MLQTSLSVDLLCGGQFANESGTLLSPGYPLYYGIGDLCWWNIAVENASAIRLIFNDFYTNVYVRVYYTTVSNIAASGYHTGRSLVVRSTNGIRLKLDVGSYAALGNYRFNISWIAVFGRMLHNVSLNVNLSRSYLQILVALKP